jgi:hypothetical protein
VKAGAFEKIERDEIYDDGDAVYAFRLERAA